MVAGEQDVGHAAALPIGRAREVRVFEEVLGKTFLDGAVGGAHDARQQADAGVEQRERRGFAAGEDEEALAFLKLLRPRGTLVCAGVGKPDAVLTLPHNLVMLSGKTLRGTIEGDADPRTFVPRMVGWYHEGRLPLERIVRTYPFEAIDEAVADMVSGRVVKPVLVFEQE